jgi:RND family efflux transporter MFP subunit
MARVNLEKADLALEKTRVMVDFTGLVLAKQVETGEYVNPGQTLGVLYEKGQLDVEIRIPLAQMAWIRSDFKPGNSADVHIWPVGSGSLEKLPWKGCISRIKAQMDEKTRTLPMTVEIETTADRPVPGDLRPGLFVRCQIQGQAYDHLFILPRYVLKAGDILYLVRDQRLKKQPVSILRRFGDQVYIQKGLLEGDQVVISPLPGAVDGMKLVVKAAETP